MNEELERVVIYAMKELDSLGRFLEIAAEEENVDRIASIAREMRAIGDDVQKAVKDFEASVRGVEPWR